MAKETAMVIPEGTILANRYRVLNKLGAGGMATIFRAVDLITHKNVAIKITKPEILQNASGQERFEIEKEAFAKLSQNANIVKLFDVIKSEGSWLIILELVEGGTLKDKFNDFGAMTLFELQYYFSSICNGLSDAHKMNIVHRDIKPDNILLTSSGEVKIGDFGISVMKDYKWSRENAEKAVGTPKYIPPEVISAEQPTPASDIYSLGIMLYEFATGVAPFMPNSAKKSNVNEQTMLMQSRSLPIPPTKFNPSIPQALENIILKMIEKNPEHRYQDVDRVKKDLLATNPSAKPKPYHPHKIVRIKKKGKFKKTRIGNSYDMLPQIARSKFSIIFIALIFILTVSLAFIFIFQ